MKKQYNENLNKYNSHNILWKNAHITTKWLYIKDV